MNTAYLLIGGNEGNREATLYQCVQMLRRTVGHIINLSPLYETASWGKEDLPPHLNQAIQLETEFDAATLLTHVLEIEHLLGRTRSIQWGSRKIDIDIIFFNREVIHTPNLQIPHPWMQLRRFVLQPLADIAADYVHPVSGLSVSELLKTCTDDLSVQVYISEDTEDSLL